MIEYRKAILEDIDMLAKIRGIFLLEVNGLNSEEKRLEIEEANRRYFNDALSNGDFIAWLALDENKIVATSGLSFSLVPPSLICPEGKVAYIMNMYTSPQYRGKGIASELFKRIIDEAKNCGYKKITLNATDMGRPIYEKFGFKDAIGEMVYYFE